MSRYKASELFPEKGGDVVENADWSDYDTSKMQEGDVVGVRTDQGTKEFPPPIVLPEAMQIWRVTINGLATPPEKRLLVFMSHKGEPIVWFDRSDSTLHYNYNTGDGMVNGSFGITAGNIGFLQQGVIMNAVIEFQITGNITGISMNLNNSTVVANTVWRDVTGATYPSISSTSDQYDLMLLWEANGRDRVSPLNAAAAIYQPTNKSWSKLTYTRVWDGEALVPMPVVIRDDVTGVMWKRGMADGVPYWEEL